MIDIFNPTEKVLFSLRELFTRNGFLAYKMGKFEEYDFYIRHKEFLSEGGILSFTDTSGKLMALKPDVTLSIIRSHDDDFEEKVYYNENVYRKTKNTNSFKEIMQAGVESIGTIDTFKKREIIALAIDALKTIGKPFVLELSSLDILSSIVNSITSNRELQYEILKKVGEKNIHDISDIAEKNDLNREKLSELYQLLMLSGSFDEIRENLLEIVGRCGLIKEFDDLESAVKGFDNIRIDFSIFMDRNYYNGLIFKGYIEGVPESVISGGQYDNLMRRLKKSSQGIGFAVYVNNLEFILEENSSYDIDVMITGGSPKEKECAKEKYISENCSVCVMDTIDPKIRYRILVDLDKKGETL